MTRLADVDICIEKIKQLPIVYDAETVQRCIEVLSNVPTIDAEQWHVIKKRPMTNDERIEWSEEIGHGIEDEDAFIYFNLPDDGEEVLVSTQFGLVYVDTFCEDEGCYFEENGDMDGIVAWMEKPKPYRGKE